jgi:3'-5' exoribonuclease
MGLKALVAGSTVEDPLEVLVLGVTEGITKKGDPYLKLNLRDLTGELEARLWKYDKVLMGFIKVGVVLAITGRADSYMDQVQMHLDSVTLVDKDPMVFAKMTRFDIDVMWGYVGGVITGMTEPLTKAVARQIMTGHQSFIAAYKKAPAAKAVHNAWYGGLLEHVYSLCLLARPVIGHYQRHYCDRFSADKVYFGLLLHDAGKIIEYDASNPAFPLTGEGIFANHMVLGPAWAYEKANLWWAENKDVMPVAKFRLERAHLMHVLAAHHGRVDWGSPVVPASLEAILVHHLDNLDAKMLHAMDYVDGAEGPTAGFSEKSWIERACYYQYPDCKVDSGKDG